MPIADIIREIDATLSRLRDARDLLSTPATVARRERRTRAEKKIARKKTATAVSNRPRIQENSSRSNSIVRRRKKVEDRVNPVSQGPSPVARPAADSEQPPIVATPSALQRTDENEKSSSDKQKPPTESTHRSGVRQTLKARLEKIKPAGALAGPVSSKIVVVSAEEAIRERERARHSEVRHHRVPVPGQSGRLAFEALFKD